MLLGNYDYSYYHFMLDISIVRLSKCLLLLREDVLCPAECRETPSSYSAEQRSPLQPSWEFLDAFCSQLLTREILIVTWSFLVN